MKENWGWRKNIEGRYIYIFLGGKERKSNIKDNINRLQNNWGCELICIEG